MTLHFNVPAAPAAKWSHWTPEQIEVLRVVYPQRGLLETAQILGVSTARIRHKANVLGIKQDHASEFFKTWQGKAATSKVGKKRPDQAAVMQTAILDKGLHHHSAEVRAAVGRMTAERIARNGHPKGFKGGVHTEMAKQAIGARATAFWHALSEDQRAELTLKQLKARDAAGGLFGTRPHGAWKAGWREIDGQRCYFRSRWESNYAAYLGFLRRTGNIAKWEHEPVTFWFEAIKRGCRSYLPDFRVTENDGSVAFHEVKGWMDERSITKIKRMRIYHPKVKLIVIEKKAYDEIKRKLSSLLPEWES